MDTRLETITPEIAKAYLATSKGNRATKKAWRDALVEIIKSGGWMITHQGIAFDATGALRDGHHRLSAIAEAGISVEILVTRGLEPNANDAIDIGRVRTVADVLLMPRKIVEIARLGCTMSFGNTQLPEIDRVKSLMKSEFGSISVELLGRCGSTRRYFTAAPWRLAAVVLVMEGENKDDTFNRYDDFASSRISKVNKHGQSLFNREISGDLKSISVYESFTRALVALHKRSDYLSKSQISDTAITESIERVRTIVKSICEVEA